ncbi:hypothetical protein H632_c4922p0, partial [Helicosporidium sp. ATCC 50920]
HAARAGRPLLQAIRRRVLQVAPLRGRLRGGSHGDGPGLAGRDAQVPGRAAVLLPRVREGSRRRQAAGRGGAQPAARDGVGGGDAHPLLQGPPRPQLLRPLLHTHQRPALAARRGRRQGFRRGDGARRSRAPRAHRLPPIRAPLHRLQRRAPHPGAHVRAARGLRAGGPVPRRGRRRVRHAPGQGLRGALLRRAPRG